MLMLMPMQQRLAALAACAPGFESCRECEPIKRRSLAARLSGIVGHRFFKLRILTKC
jgi:hypothetical protein